MIRRPPRSTRSATLFPDTTLVRSDVVAGLAGNIGLSLPAQPSIVVLPFETDGDAEHRNVALGLTHDVMTRIARTRAFFVIARGSAFRFASGSHDLHDVSRVLGVRYVVQGDVRISGSGMHINVALADAVEGRELWAASLHPQPEHAVTPQAETTTQLP